MADNRTMAELLQAPTEGYEDAIVVPEIEAANFEIKHGLLTLVQNKQFFGHDKEDPHAHIRAWERFKISRACPHHGFSELHQLDTFYNALNVNDTRPLCTPSAGGNFLDKRPRDCSSIIESKSKVRHSRSKAIVAKVSTSASTSGISPDVAELKDMVRALLLDKQTSPVVPAPAPVKAVEQSCVTCELDECLALADLGASINLMPLSVFEKLNRQGLTKNIDGTHSNWAARSISTPTWQAEDVFVKVGTFYFPADFVVVDYDADPRVPLILGRPFLRTARALIDVHGEKMTLRHDDQSVTFKVGDTKKFSYNAWRSINKSTLLIYVWEYSQEILGFSEVLTNGNSTPYFEPIVDTTSPTLTPFEGSDFILEEIEAELSDTSYKSGIDDAECDPKGNLLS
ncbi:reverse transcriptase domain-containing protein [Tanacetum coccineum]